jgi:uncharacterized protein (DUF2062 family)
MMKSSGKTRLNDKQDKKRVRQKHPFARLKRMARLTYLKILRIDDPPERIARGAAIGVAVGVLPTFGIGIIFALGAAYLLNANKAAAVLGGFIMNPVTSPLFLTASMLAGSVLMHEDYHAIYARMMENGFLTGAGSASLVFLTGNIALTVVMTVAAYYIVRCSITRHRRKKEERRRIHAHGKKV